jgi:hypothetical protein
MKFVTYKTSDCVLAATLIMHNVELSSIDKNGNTPIFVFNQVDKHLLLDFDLGNVQVEPTKFMNIIKQLTTSVRHLLSKI